MHKLGLVNDVFSALTDHCYVETLQVVAVMTTIENYLMGSGRTFYLSALLRDRSGKMQTAEMRLLHDVIVEMPMNSFGYTQLQLVLAKYGMQFVMMHSCGGDIIPDGRESYLAWWHSIKDQQLARTWLDWTTTTIPDSSNDEVISRTHMTQEDFAVIDKIFSLSRRLAKIISSESGLKRVA